MRGIRLAIFDIDGTLRRVRSPWWHLHEHLGLAEAARAYAPMFDRGEITYERWAQLDAALWRGRTRDEMAAALESNPLRQGADRLVAYLTARGVPCTAVSTGLSLFAEPTAEALGLGEVVCNRLLFEGDRCRGRVEVRVTEHNKAEVMAGVLRRAGVRAEEAIVFGDGPADVPMFEAAGLAVAVCPTAPAVRAAADYVVEDEPIDAVIADLERHIPRGGSPDPPRSL